MLSFERTMKLYRFCFCFSVLFSLATLLSTFTVYAQEETQAQEKTADSKNGDKESDNKSTEEASTKEKTAPTPVEIFAPVDALKQQESDLQHYLPKKDITPLLAGAEDFITLISKNTSRNQKGVMILLPDWQLNATSPRALNSLREKLPTQGWTTITIQPPNKPENYPSLALEEKIRVEENNEIITNYQTKLATILAAVMAEAKNYPGIFVMVSEGNHAALLVNLYSNEKLEPPNALIMLSSYLPTALDNDEFAKKMAVLTLPILDLYLTRDHPLSQSNALIRKQQATKEMKTYYRQKQLSSLSAGYYPQETLLVEINGWLKSIGW
jgi:lipopolysaccharide export LptBFGC system permease protein LptF